MVHAMVQAPIGREIIEPSASGAPSTRSFRVGVGKRWVARK